MATCGDLITEAAAQLHGWGQTQDRVAVLTGAITSTALTLTVDNAFGQSVGITPGMVEIDAEQLYVTAVDQATGTCTLANGFGRAFAGTTAAPHAAGAKIISRPKFPRISIFENVNAVLGAVYPDLFSVNKFETTVTYPIYSYALPATPIPIWIIRVQWQTPVGNWIDAYSYQLNPYDGSLMLGSGPMIGRPLRVLYAAEIPTFISERDDYSITGLPPSTFDVITLGTIVKMTPGLDISRAQLTSVEQSDRSRVIPPNAGINVSTYLQKLYQQRLTNEARTLRRIYRPRLRRIF